MPGDPSQLRQVFVNLLENALQSMTATAAGSVDRPVRVRVRGAVVGGKAEVSFEGDGPGMAPAALQRLFEPLNTTKPNGVGLGLAHCRRLAERHGGTLTHAPGAAGARFAFTLPLSVNPSAAPVATHAGSQADSKGSV